MTLEVLFAQQGQAETFLRMVLLGAAFALALTSAARGGIGTACPTRRMCSAH